MTEVTMDSVSTGSIALLVVAATAQQVLRAKQQSLVPPAAKEILRADQLNGYKGSETIIILLHGLPYDDDDQLAMLRRVHELASQGASLIRINT